MDNNNNKMINNKCKANIPIVKINFNIKQLIVLMIMKFLYKMLNMNQKSLKFKKSKINFKMKNK